MFPSRRIVRGIPTSTGLAEFDSLAQELSACAEARDAEMTAAAEARDEWQRVKSEHQASLDSWIRGESQKEPESVEDELVKLASLNERRQERADAYARRAAEIEDELVASFQDDRGLALTDEQIMSQIERAEHAARLLRSELEQIQTLQNQRSMFVWLQKGKLRSRKARSPLTPLIEPVFEALAKLAGHQPRREQVILDNVAYDRVIPAAEVSSARREEPMSTGGRV